MEGGTNRKLRYHLGTKDELINLHMHEIMHILSFFNLDNGVGLWIVAFNGGGDQQCFAVDEGSISNKSMLRLLIRENKYGLRLSNMGLL
ncbi:hypothetical protein D3C73_448070 [compost metagenome]